MTDLNLDLFQSTKLGVLTVQFSNGSIASCTAEKLSLAIRSLDQNNALNGTAVKLVWVSPSSFVAYGDGASSSECDEIIEEALTFRVKW